MTTPTRQDLIWADVRRRPDDRRPPASIIVGAVFMLQLTWVGIGHGLLPHAVLIGGVLVSAGVAALWLTLPAALALAVISFLVVNGFVEGSYGTLTWSGAGDLTLLTAFVLLCLLAAEAAYDLRWSKPGRARPSDQVHIDVVPWWYDDDLVELSLTLPDEPDTHDGHGEPHADDGAPDAADVPELHATATGTPTSNDTRTDAR